MYGVKYAIDNLGKAEAKVQLDMELSEKIQQMESKQIEEVWTLERIKFDGILLEQIGSILLGGKLTDKIEKLEMYEKKLDKKDQKKEKTFKLELILVLSLLGTIVYWLSLEYLESLEWLSLILKVLGTDLG